MPTVGQISKGPFEVDEETDKDIGINQHYMELLFCLMPAIAGVQVWRGAARCHRILLISRHFIKVACKNSFGGELNVPEALSVTGKWTSQAVRSKLASSVAYYLNVVVMK